MRKNKYSAAAYKFKIGSYIRKWRNIKDIKQKDLAAALQLSEASVSNIENDITNITIGQLEEISIALNVSMEQLLSDPQEKMRHSIGTGFEVNERAEQYNVDKELLNAIISSMEKKDQQMQVIMQNFLHSITALMQHEKIVLNPSKQIASRA